MPYLEKVPRRSISELIYATGHLRIVASILTIPPGLSVEEVEPIIEKSHKFDIPTILTAMTGQVDGSGLAPNFVGVDNLCSIQILSKPRAMPRIYYWS